MLLLAAAVGLRVYRVATSYDLFIDEVTYRQIAVNVARGDGLTLYGAPFTLHPPSGFVLLGGAARLLGLDGPPIADVDALRVVTACVGALVVPAVYLLMTALGAGWRASVVAAALVAVDPFQISFDSRVMLEPVAQLFVVLCLLGLAAWATRPGRAGLLLQALAGLAGALAMTTKETFGLVLGATLLLVLATGVVPRRATGRVLAVAVAGYAASAAWTSVTYGFDSWWGFRTDGLARLLGHKQSTGFNSEGTTVSLLSRFTADLDVLVVTYGLLVLGGIGSLVLLSRAWRSRAGTSADPSLVVPLWALAACAYLGYATLLGSIEEQMYYIPLAPCALTAVMWAATWAPSIGHRYARLVVVTIVAATICFESSVWYRTHHVDSNAYRSFMAWAPEHLTGDLTIATTDGITQFLLQEGRLGTWNTPRQLKANDVDFVLVQTKLVREGYGPGTLSMANWVAERGDLVFSAAAGPGDELEVYDIRAVTGGSQ